MLVILLAVASITMLAAWLVQRQTEDGERERTAAEFEQAFNAQLGIRKSELAALAEACRSLARKPRIIAALEEDSVDDLYANAAVELELRGLIGPKGATAQRPAMLFRFLDRNGGLIPPPKTTPATWESQMTMAPLRPQQIATYLTPGDGSVVEAMTTPVTDTATGETFGALVLCFTPTNTNGGIWINRTLYFPSLDAEAFALVRSRLETSGNDRESVLRGMELTIRDTPHRLYLHELDAPDATRNASFVGLYSLAESAARQSAERWRIITTGLLVLLIAYVAVYFVAAKMSSPVEKLEATSEGHRMGRERAEAALDLTNEELRARNEELAGALERLKAAQQQHVQQERLRALGQMASGVAHDFNNALVPILGFSDLLLMSPETLADPEKTRTYIQSIQTAASDAASVVARLREFYRSSNESEKFTPVDLCKLVNQAVTLTRPRWRDQAMAAGATIEVKTELASVPPVAGDEAGLREVLTNLVFNAVDAMPSGGIITIRVKPEGERVLLEIQDTGTGMSEEVRCRCLEPFFSTKGERGTGLGLSMVFGIIQRHSGLLDIQSQIGTGTTFRISLPLHVEARPAAESEQRVPTGLRLLVVEDEEPVRETLAAALAHDRHEVTLAVHGVDGLRKFMDGRFDVVITDRAMPGMSGDEMAATMKQARPGTRIILLTGFGQFLEKERFPEVDFIASKPITVNGLREALLAAITKS